ncbi:acyltransferase [Thaumasiovibrio subtropicus]|uniref:acyltransferase n=1 Tax=Thaumasiovibrio subtropicus TaxID=1891207 RepID=UPI000B35D110|nr:acyltransferase [Thaumasiovibrio subtropicus]
MQREKVAYIDLMRCVAAIAVVAIHVLGPYRYQISELAAWDWSMAIAINSASRWAVPLFIMISGALLLSDTRPFDLSYYLKRRVGKVVVPFLVWSLFYALLSGLTKQGWQWESVVYVLKDAWRSPTYYHLGFFYYFIPLYIVVPWLRYLCQQCAPLYWQSLLMAWLLLVSANLLRLDGVWSQDILFYSGYLLAGYGLYHMIQTHWWHLRWPFWVVVMMGAIALTAYQVIVPSLAAERYLVGRWLSYKTLNTAVIAAAVFVLCQQAYALLSPQVTKVVGEVSRYSLGIYLLHPIVLWPVREWSLYWGPSVVMIVVWTFVALWGAWWMTRYLASRARWAWLVP